MCDRIRNLIKRNLADEVYDSFMQFVKFGIVGVSNTAISYIVYLVSLLSFRKLGILLNNGYLVAQVIAFVLSVLWSFFWNSRLVFTLKEGEERSVIRTLIKTFVSYSFTGLFLNSVLLILWVRVMHISELIAPIINLLVSVPLNFVINKFWAFRKKG
ncbi:MAG: GtrA family protein [Lachnospiraceae bacterium]|nr:GtrA family protein [Lachnospiraceae bacterium]MBD5503527.1 GtrA family protein [Lachnospiraceae bacterium]